jgi:hypothetical protein
MPLTFRSWKNFTCLAIMPGVLFGPKAISWYDPQLPKKNCIS